MIWKPDVEEYEWEFHRSGEEIADERGCVVEYPDEYTLQIDLDSEKDKEFLLEQLERVESYGGQRVPVLTLEDIRSSKTDGHFHAFVRSITKMSIQDKVMWQALLGSDRVREILNLLRHYKGVPDPIRLFVPKER